MGGTKSATCDAGAGLGLCCLSCCLCLCLGSWGALGWGVTTCSSAPGSGSWVLVRVLVLGTRAPQRLRLRCGWLMGCKWAATAPLCILWLDEPGWTSGNRVPNLFCFPPPALQPSSPPVRSTGHYGYAGTVSNLVETLLT